MSASGAPAGPSRLIARNAAVRTGGEVLAKLASVALFVAIARELGESGFGDFSFALSFTTVLLLVAGFGTDELIAREVARRRNEVHKYLTDVVAIKAAISVAMLLVAAAVVNVADYPSDVRLAVYLLGAAVAVENLAKTWGAVFQAFERMEYISLSLIAQRFATAAVGIGVLLAGGGLVAVSAVVLGGAVLGFGVGAWALSRHVVRPRLELQRARWWPLVRAGIPIGILGVLLGSLVKLDQTLLSFLSDEPGNVEVGFFGAAFRLIEATMFIGWAFSAAMLPWFARHADGGADERRTLAGGYELALKATAAALVPVGISFILLAGPLIDLFYGARYGPSVEPLRLLGVMVVLVGVNDLTAVLLIARDRPLAYARIVAAVTGLNIALNVVLIPRYGASGAAFTAAASALVLAVLGFWVAWPLTGRLRVIRSFGGAVAGGGAMTAVVLPSSFPLVPAAALGLTAYAVGYVAFEWAFFRDDLGVLARLARRRSPVEAS